MSLRVHGNWCGPGWTAGKWMNAADMTEEDKKIDAIDALDQACKNHDINLAEGNPDADKIFEEEAGKLGIKGYLFSNLVHYLGPQRLAKYMEKRIRKRIRSVNPNPLQSIQDAIDRKNEEDKYITPDRPPSRIEPTMTRKDIPLIGYRPRDLDEPVANLPA